MNYLKKLKKRATFLNISILVAYLLFVLTCFFFFKEPTFADWKTELAFLQKTTQNEKAEHFLHEQLTTHLHDIALHYAYITNHFKIPKNKRYGRQTVIRDDKTIHSYYASVLPTSDAMLVNIRHYAMGLLASHEEKYELAEYYFDLIEDDTMPYVHNSKGYILKEWKQFEEAEILFKKELRLSNGNFSSAYSNLFSTYMEQQRYDEFLALSKTPEAREFIPLHMLRRICIVKDKPLLYIQLSLRHDFEHAHILGFIAATGIMLFWLFYLRQLDVFEPEKWHYLWLALGLGIVFSFAALPLYDLMEQFWGFDLNGQFFNDLVYCIFGIGIIEEFVKIVPLLLLLAFPQITNEPFDYVLYASVSALGFSYMENIMYFDKYSMDILHGRATYSTVSHMVDSSIIAYGLYMNNLVWKKPLWLVFPAFLLVAATAHGLYDFFLVNETASLFSILTTVVFISELCIWNIIKTNALNHSSFFDLKIKIEMEKLNRYLVLGIFFLMSYEFFALSWVAGAPYAMRKIFYAFFATFFIFSYLSPHLTQFKLAKGKMWPLRYWPSKGNEEAPDRYQDN